MRTGEALQLFLESVHQHWRTQLAAEIAAAMGTYLAEADPIATNIAGGEITRRNPNETHDEWLYRSYMADIPRIEMEKAEKKGRPISHEEAKTLAHPKAVTNIAKQKHAHGRLTGILGRLLAQPPQIKPPSRDLPPEAHPPGAAPQPQSEAEQESDDSYHIVSVGSGMGHEQALSHDDLDKKHNWTGLEYQQSLVDSANARNQDFGITNADNQQWSVYDGSREELAGLEHQRASEMHPDDWEDRIGQLPEGERKILYLKHACGGLTDAALKKAIEHGYHAVVAHTCCSNRYAGLSHDIVGGETPFSRDEELDRLNTERAERGEDRMSHKRLKSTPKGKSGSLDHRHFPEEDDRVSFGTWQGLVSASQQKGTQRGMRAQQRIDEHRHEYLQNNGYTVRHGWFSQDGKPEPAGGHFVAVRNDQQHLLDRLNSPELMQDVERSHDSHEQPQQQEHLNLGLSRTSLLIEFV